MLVEQKDKGKVNSLRMSTTSWRYVKCEVLHAVLFLTLYRGELNACVDLSLGD
jgi:hypothetical protein